MNYSPSHGEINDVLDRFSGYSWWYTRPGVYLLKPGKEAHGVFWLQCQEQD